MQKAIVKGLYANADAIKATRTQRLKADQVDRAGIGLKGDFRIRCHGKAVS